MHPLKVWQEWTEEVGRLASGATVWQQRALALFSLGLAAAQDCSMAQVAAGVPGVARVPSTLRRVERLGADEHPDARRGRAGGRGGGPSPGRGAAAWLGGGGA